MQEITPGEKLTKRMNEAYKALLDIAKKKTPSIGKSALYSRLAGNLGVTHATVWNYLEYKKGRKGNGYFIDALIEEFKKVPDKK